MTMTKLAFLLLAAASLVESVIAFSPPVIQHLHVRSTPSSVSRSLPVVESAKVLPFAYSGASAALLYRATKAVSKTDKAVLVATAVLSLFNLGPTDNARLSSAKRAMKRYPSCTPISAARTNALKWRMLVRIKLVGQLIGLVYMAVSKSGIMQGAAIVMATNVIFFLGGAGNANHDSDGAAAPMPASKSAGLLTLDTVLTVAALIAASSPVDSSRYVRSALLYAGGAAIGGLEGLAVLIAKLAEK